MMNPRTHPRGAPPDFTLPRPNPNPLYMTDALWWLVCMRELLEPEDTENGGTFADKRGYHNRGQNLPDYGPGNIKTDHSIRRAPDRSGPHWLTKCSAHDWTFKSAQRGDYRNISKYTKRLVDSMRSSTDTRPDDVYAYTIGQVDNDRVVEGWNEYTDDPESGDTSHLWHRHDSFRRGIIGSFWAMWKALTIDMGWTFAEWQRSVAPPEKEWDEMASKSEIEAAVKAGVKAALEEPHRFPGRVGERVHDRDGWAVMGDRTALAYIFEAVMNIGATLRDFIAYEKAEDLAERAGDTGRAESLARLEESLTRLEALVKPADPAE